MEWHSETPDGRKMVIRRLGEYWVVRCGRSLARSENLDVALTRTIRAETKARGEVHEVDFGTWARDVADRLARAV